jgi:Flp pilus assembly protein TadG
LIEFALSALMLIILLFGVFEITRMLLVYTTIANSARIGTRFAIAHGSSSGTAAATASDVQAVVTNYLGTAPMNTGSALISVTGAGGAIGSTVTVTVNYQYDPFMTYFPLNVYLASTSQGVIAF